MAYVRSVRVYVMVRYLTHHSVRSIRNEIRKKVRQYQSSFVFVFPNNSVVTTKEFEKIEKHTLHTARHRRQKKEAHGDHSWYVVARTTTSRCAREAAIYVEPRGEGRQPTDDRRTNIPTISNHPTVSILRKDEIF